MRCCGGVRTEDCKCRELFKLYISSNHQMYVNTVTTPANLAKLLKGKTKLEILKIINDIDNCIDAFKREFLEEGYKLFPEYKICSVCNERQFETPSGLTCKNGHGGAPSK